MASSPAPRVECEFEALCKWIVETLQGKADFSHAKILGDETGDLSNAIAQDLARLGLSIVVSIPSADDDPVMSARGVFIADIVITAAEDVLKNRKKTGKSALYLATRIYAHLKHARPPCGFLGDILPAKSGKVLRKLNIIVDPTKPADEQPSVVGWSVNFTCQVAIQPRSNT